MISGLEIWMSIVGFLSALAEVPQILKLWKRKSSDDISLISWLLIYFAQASWVRYGITIGSLCIVFTNAINLIFTITILILCVKYSQRGDKP